jgi:REP element-mobilizing transposase RayT
MATFNSNPRAATTWIDFGSNFLIILMVKCLQKIVTQAKYRYNLAVHVASWYSCSLITFNITRNHMDFSFSYPRATEVDKEVVDGGTQA